MRARQDSLLAALAAKKIPALLVTKPENIFYLTGFRGSAGACVWGPEQPFLWVDPRYTAQAREQACGAEVIETRESPLRAAGKWLGKRRLNNAGFEDGHLTVSDYEDLRREAPAVKRWAPASDLIENLRGIKDEHEIDCIRRACQVTVDAFEEAAGTLRPGISERDLASELEYRMRRHGAEGAAFETIVASGARGALPHARPSAKLLEPGDFVICDLGAILGGYRADLTRTVHLGEPPGRARSLYRAVLEAQRVAVQELQPGAVAGSVHAATKRALARRGVARFFTHSTGHGVGLEIHERPRIGRGGKSYLRAGNVVTAEPGIYVEGLGGIRIEDTVLVTPEGPEILTTAAKDHWFLL
ncbi:MAG: M24 family metallopeptidase [Terriglobia bacterium]